MALALDFPFSSKRRRISVEDGNSNTYDVFISFRGEDTRNNFTSHVCAALSRKHIKFFIDNKNLRTGNEISSSLLDAIQKSQLYLVIFSPDYGSSRWCLIELENILICSSQHGKKVLPVFYKVDPSDIRNQTGSVGINFGSQHEGSDETEKVLKWRASLKHAGGLKGVHVNDHRSEPEFIDDIVSAILGELKPMLPLSNISTNLVGINQHSENIERLWTGIQDVANLKWMDLARSRYLIEIPDMSKAKNMEGIILKNCRRLIRLHPSIQHLQKLEVLHLSRCYNLSEIPSKLESKVLKEFDLMSCYKIRESPELCGDNLDFLVLKKSDTQEFIDLRKFVNLRILYLFHCRRIAKCPKIPSSLRHLIIVETSIKRVLLSFF